MNKLEYQSPTDRRTPVGILAWSCLASSAAAWAWIFFEIIFRISTHWVYSLRWVPGLLLFLSLATGTLSIAVAIYKRRPIITFIVAGIGLVLAIIPLVLLLALWQAFEHHGFHH